MMCNADITTGPVDISGTVMGESLDCRMISRTVVGKNPDHVCVSLGKDCNMVIILLMLLTRVVHELHMSYAHWNKRDFEPQGMHSF